MVDVPDEHPEELKRNGRTEDAEFCADELLYRRFKEEDLDGVGVEPDAIELPDMSVNRSKYCTEVAWTLIPIKRDTERDKRVKWGVFRFFVKDIPPGFEHITFRYTFAPRHVHHPKNYSHTEIWAFKDEEHIDVKNSEWLLDPDAHQRWRQLLAWKCKVELQPQLV